jgi:hypothetical protein
MAIRYLSGINVDSNTLFVDDANNRVGIGTASPGSKLDVDGDIGYTASSAIYPRKKSVAADWYVSKFDGGSNIDNSIGSSGDTAFRIGYWGGGTFAPNIKLSAGGGNSSYISSGNVGIGTTSPSVKLEIADSIPVLRITGTRDSSWTIDQIIASLEYFSKDTSGTAANSVRASINLVNETSVFGSTTGLSFSTKGDVAGLPTERMRITAAGNVGIGTTSPTSQLHVQSAFPELLLYNTTTAGGTLNFVDQAWQSQIVGIQGNLLFKTGGTTERVRITNDGNVGIGTTSPGHKLDVEGNIRAKSGTYYIGTTATNYLSSDGANVYLRTNAVHYFEGNGLQKGAWNSSGNLGIGTISPNEKLSLAGSTGTTFGLSLEPSGWNSAKHRFTVPVSGDTSMWSFNYNGSVVDSSLYATSSIQIGQGAILFSTGGTNTAPSEKMRITSAGNVGIGTTSPAGILDIIGDGNGTTSSYSQIHVRNSNPAVGDNVAARITFNGDGGTTVYGFIEQRRDAYDSLAIGTKNSTSGDAGYVGIYTRGTEKIRITGVGNVGIGTTSPGYKLDVAGSINTNDVYRIGGNTILSGTTSVAVGSSGGTGSVALRTTSGDGLVLSGSSVGIGTTSPADRLYVGNTTGTSISVSTNLAAGTNGSPLNLDLNFRGYADAKMAMIRSWDESASTGNGHLTFWTNEYTGVNVFTEKMRIGPTGSIKLNSYGSGTKTGTATQRLAVDASGNVIEIPIGSGPVDGNGTANYVTKWSDADTITNSIIYDNGTNVGVGTTSLTQKFHVNGNIALGDVLYLNSVSGAIWNSANGALRFGTNATERARFDAAGNFGIGTTSPGAKLEVAGGSANWNETTPGTAVGTIHLNPGVSTDNFGNAITFGASDAGGGATAQAGIYLRTDGAYGTKMYFATTDSYASGSKTRMFIGESGNIGIGTTSPANTLDIAAAQATLKLQSTTGTNTVFARLENTAGTFYIGRDNSAGSSFGFANAAILYETGANPMVFLTNSAERLRITSAGNVGIGTTSPSYKLDVTGDIRSTGNIRSNNGTVDNILSFTSEPAGVVGTLSNHPEAFWTNGSERMRITSGGNVGIGTTSVSERLTVVSSGAGVSAARFTDANRADIVLSFPSTGVASIDSYQGTGDGTLAFRTAANERMRITSTGNVGIGTTSPQSKLQIGTTNFSITDRTSAVYGAAASETIFTVGISGVDYPQLLNFGVNQSGLYSTISARQFTVATENKLVLQPNGGNVGIGTTSPSAKLEVIGQGSGSVKMGSTGFGGDWVGISLSGNLNTTDYNLLSSATNASFYLNRPSGGDMLFRHNNVDQMIIKSGGNVGIGTTSPNNKLEVVGGVTIGTSASSTVNLYLTRTNAGIAADANYFVSANNTPNQTWIEGGYYNGELSGVVTAPNSGYPYIETYSGQGGSTTKSFGFINKTSGSFTSADLFITMSLLRTGRVTFNKYGAGTFTGTATQRLAVDASGNVIEIPIGSGPVDGNGTANYVTKWSDADTITNSIIYDNGTNVGIGTAGPGAKLHVSGSTYIRNDNSTNQLTIDNDSVGSNAAPQYSDVLFGGYSSTLRARIRGIDRASSITRGGIILQASTDGTTLVDRLFLDGNGESYFYNNSAEVMRITSAGNVGIGTTSPAVRLDYGASVNQAFHLYTSGVDYYGINMTQYDSGPYSTNIFSGNNGQIKFRTATDTSTQTTRMTITQAGNVGIGTTSPASPLDVNGIISSRGTHIAQNSGTYNIIYNASNSIAMYLGGSADPGNYYDNNAHRFRNAGGGTTYAIITTAGNVGIGTTSPAQMLHVTGNGLFNGNLDVGQGVSTQDSVINVGAGRTGNGYAYIDLIGDTTYTDYALRIIRNNSGANAPSQIIHRGTGDFSLSTNEAANLTFGTSASERMRINGSGNVGIGTTAPSSKLNIVGGFIRVEGTEVDQFFLEGIRTGTSTTVRIYDNSSTAYYDSYSNMIFRANQLGGSGGYIGLFGGNVGINQGAPSQRLHVTGNVRVTGAYYDSNNEAGTSGQVLTSTGTGTDWVTPATTTATSLYDLLPAARVAYNWTGQVVNDTWVDIFSAANNILTTGTWMVQMYISDWAQGGQHYTYTYTGTMQWYQETVNQAGEAAASEIYLHRMGHAANASALYLRTTEMTAASGGIGKLQIKANYSNTSNTTINFKFVKIF